MAERDMSKLVTIPGELHSAATGNITAAASEVFDYDSSKYQNDINSQWYKIPDTEQHTLEEAIQMIPAKVRRGGMKLTFISDIGEYESYNYKNVSILDSDFYDVDNWNIISEEQNISNPEFLKVWVDKENNVLLGIQTYGNVYFGAGVPEQIKNYIINKINDVNVKINKIDSSLNLKVDKVDGESLINENYINEIETSEFIRVYTDASDHILWGIKNGGGIYYGAGIPEQIKREIIKKVDKIEGSTLIPGQYVQEINTTEFIRIILDSSNHIIQYIKPDGTYHITGNVEVEGDIDMSMQSIKLINNNEYLTVSTDSQGRLISGVKKDGSHYIYNVQSESIYDIKNNVSNANKHIETIDEKLHTLRKISIIGDSISTFDEDGFKIDGYAMWYPNTGDRSSDVISVEDTWWKQVINNQGGIIEVNASYSGSTVSSYNVGFSPRVHLLGNPDVIYIALGTNDSTLNTPIGDFDYDAETYDLSQFAPAYIKGIKDTIALYPTAEIICIAFDMNEIYQDAIEQIANHYGLEYIYVGDITDVHPNKAEMKAAANRISDIFITLENIPEYIEAKLDSEGKILAGRTLEGAAFENVGFSTPKVSIDGHTTENVDDIEGRTELLTDNENKIISYRDANGVKVEESGLKLGKQAMSDFASDLRKNDYISNDWSDKKELHIAEPYCAKINFTNIGNIPQVKYSDDERPHAYMQFWDMNGNYFKKEVLINAQGRSSMGHPKKNIAIDICNNNGWDDDDTFSLQIGDWVPQDSFHLKAFYNDPFRCLSPVAYKLYDEILKSRGEFNDYVWKRALLDLNAVTATSTGCADAEEATDGWNTNARCFPMGFPCIVYVNGEFYGIYSWQLKKHRDNYQMSKKKTKHIHLDGIISLERILNADGDTTKIWWTTTTPEGFEIRNPKPKKKKDGWELTIMDGTKYDADANGGELIDSTSANWDSTNISHTKSAEVKQYILNMSKIIPALTSAYSTYQASSKTAADKEAFKEVFETYFDVDNLVDYLIFSDVLANYDGFSQNVQWITYNGVKWYLCAYDLDGVMGNWWEINDNIVAPKNAHYNYAHFQYLPIFYENELEVRYKELRDKDIISVDHISGLVENWLKRLGAKETFEKEWEKWSGFIKNDNIHRLYKWLQVSISNMDTLYNYNQN